MSGFQTWLFPPSLLYWIFICTCFLACWVFPYNLPQGSQIQCVPNWLNHFLPIQICSCSCISVLMDEILSHPTAQSTTLRILIDSSILLILDHPSKTNSCWFYYINIPYTYSFPWIICHFSGSALHHFSSRFAISSLLISLPGILKGDAIGILRKTVVHLCKMVSASNDCMHEMSVVPPSCKNQPLLPQVVLERS